MFTIVLEKMLPEDRAITLVIFLLSWNAVRITTLVLPDQKIDLQEIDLFKTKRSSRRKYILNTMLDHNYSIQ